MTKMPAYTSRDDENAGLLVFEHLNTITSVLTTGYSFEPLESTLCSISALSRRRRRHVYCAGMDVPVLKMTASARRSF